MPKKTKVIRLDKVIDQYKDACFAVAVKVNERLFNGYREFYWIGDEVGGLCDFDGTDVLSVTDMILLLEHKVKYKDYAEWRDYNIENERHINLKSWLMGLRPEMLNGTEQRERPE